MYYLYCTQVKDYPTDTLYKFRDDYPTIKSRYYRIDSSRYADKILYSFQNEEDMTLFLLILGEYFSRIDDIDINYNVYELEHNIIIYCHKKHYLETKNFQWINQDIKALIYVRPINSWNNFSNEVLDDFFPILTGKTKNAIYYKDEAKLMTIAFTTFEDYEIINNYVKSHKLLKITKSFKKKQ